MASQTHAGMTCAADCSGNNPYIIFIQRSVRGTDPTFYIGVYFIIPPPPFGVRGFFYFKMFTSHLLDSPVAPGNDKGGVTGFPPDPRGNDKEGNGFTS